MSTIPAHKKARRTTKGSKAVGDYIDRHGLRQVAVYFPLALHEAITQALKKPNETLQGQISLACNRFYGFSREDIPPLVKPTRTTIDAHKTVSWYADVDLHTRMKILAAEMRSSVQQLIISALVESLKTAPTIKALKLERGEAFARAPVDTPSADDE